MHQSLPELRWRVKKIHYACFEYRKIRQLGNMDPYIPHVWENHAFLFS
jgi:hypothetical protein